MRIYNRVQTTLSSNYILSLSFSSNVSPVTQLCKYIFFFILDGTSPLVFLQKWPIVAAQDYK
jgi:hypothetical protein